MHVLHDYVAKQLADKIKSRRVVVWYDERGEFQPFVEEMRGAPRTASEPIPVVVAGAKASLAEYAGSLFEVRDAVELVVNDDEPGALVVYIPGLAHDTKTSVLMELEKAGCTWKPDLKQLAKNVLLQKYTLGVVDEILPADRAVDYHDLRRALSRKQGSQPPSILRGIFAAAPTNEGLLAAWIASSEHDDAVVSKGALPELVALLKAAAGIEIEVQQSLAKARLIVARYVLAGEFRLDLRGQPPGSLTAIPLPPSDAHATCLRDIARRMRRDSPEPYQTLADQLEKELGLASTKIAPDSLGAIDTFRFEEKAILRHSGELVVAGHFEQALRFASERQDSFWLARDVGRRAQWEAMRRMAELGSIAASVTKAVKATSGDAAAWFAAYVAEGGWHQLDLAQRRMERWVANPELEDEVDERALGVVRRAYEDACDAMAKGFSQRLEAAGWSVPNALHQTRVFGDIVSGSPKPVAYFLVDAMRYEMGVELAERIPKAADVSLRGALCALPSITPVGMAALQPGAAASFAVVEHKGELSAQIDDRFLPGLTERRKLAEARVPTLVDLTLDELLGMPPSKLTKKLGGAQVVVVRSQEIDHAGENQFTYQARQVMDRVIDNLAHALRKLAAAGVEHSVLSADHGHLFFPAEREEAMRIDAPGGKTIDLHRRCWVGRGGTTPAGCVRVGAAALGYASDLDFVFPRGAGVFKAGGGLAFHHGGCSLQEMVIPVMTIRFPRKASRPMTKESPVTVTGVPDTIRIRLVPLTLAPGKQQLTLGATDLVVRLALVSGGRQVGAVQVTRGGQFDQATGVVTLPGADVVEAVLLLQDDDVASVRVVVQDPATDAELYRSPEDIPVKLEVH